MNGKGVYVDAEEEVEPVMHASCKVNGKEGRRQKRSRGKQVGLGPQGKKQVQGPSTPPAVHMVWFCSS